MNLEETTRWRDRIGKVAAVFFFLFAGACFDGLIALYRQPVDSSYLMPGESVKINGAMSANAKGLEDLDYSTDSEYIHLSFDEIFSSYWMGGRMWRGTLTVSPEAVSGQYHATVRSGDEVAQKQPPVFTVFVYHGPDELRNLSNSIIRRHLDLNPWRTAVAFLAFLCLTVGIVYLFSRRRESLLAEAGMADIFRIEKIDERYEVAFGLGTRHGIGIGAHLALLDGSGQVRGRVEVKRISATDSIAEVESNTEAEPGYMVRKEE